MADERIVEENGSFRLVEREGRYAVLESRNGQTTGVAPHREIDWSDETEARRLFGELARAGDRLARTIW